MGSTCKRAPGPNSTWPQSFITEVITSRDHNRDQFSAATYSKFRRPVCQSLLLTVANFPHIAKNFVRPHGTDQICSISHCKLQLIDTVCLPPNKPAIFMISSAQYFQYSSDYSASGSHVLHGEIMPTMYT